LGITLSILDCCFLAWLPWLGREIIDPDIASTSCFFPLAFEVGNLSILEFSFDNVNAILPSFAGISGAELTFDFLTVNLQCQPKDAIVFFAILITAGELNCYVTRTVKNARDVPGNGIIASVSSREQDLWRHSTQSPFSP